MCIVLIDTRHISEGKITLLSNRDEFYARPTRSIHYWEESSLIMGGKDLQEGGTWLAVDQSARFGVITNFRDPTLHKEGMRSRGWIIREFLMSKDTPEQAIEKLSLSADQFNPYTVILGDHRGVLLFNNVNRETVALSAGLHGLSNHFYHTEWFKVSRLKSLYQEIKSGMAPLTRAYFEILNDRRTPSDDQLPQTGITLEWERLLSSIFIASEQYGTRSSSVITITTDRVSLAERSYGPKGAYYGETKLSEKWIAH